MECKKFYVANQYGLKKIDFTSVLKSTVVNNRVKNILFIYEVVI